MSYIFSEIFTNYGLKIGLKWMSIYVKNFLTKESRQTRHKIMKNFDTKSGAKLVGIGKRKIYLKMFALNRHNFKCKDF